MKASIFKGCNVFFLSLAAAILMASPVSAANVKGEISSVNSGTITGWAWNPENTNDVQNVEIHILQSGNPEPVKYLHVTANQYREDLVADLKDGWHGFSAKVDWSQLSGNDFKVKAYAVKDGSYYILGDTVSYSKSSHSTKKAPPKSAMAVSADTSITTVPPLSAASPAPISAGPGFVNTSVSPVPSTGNEQSLGVFYISGYCACEICSSGLGITYAGTIPQANHTISADLTLLPLGSKVRIGDTVYTVEDKGSSIVGNMIDIFYDNHEEAIAHGRTQEEVFLVQ